MSDMAIWTNDRVRDLAAGSRVITGKADQASLLAMCSDIANRQDSLKVVCTTRVARVLLDRLVLSHGTTDRGSLDKEAISRVLREEARGIMFDDDFDEARMIREVASLMATAARGPSWNPVSHVCEIKADLNQDEAQTKESAVSACQKVKDRVRIIDKTTAPMLMK